MKDKKIKAFINIFLYLAIFVFVNLIVQLLTVTIVSNIYSLGFKELIEAMTQPKPPVSLIEPVNMASSYSTLFTYLILFLTLLIVNLHELKNEALGFKLKWNILWIALGFGVLYGGSYLISYLIGLAGVGESSNQESIVNMIKYGSAAGIFISVVICAPFAEEMIFRKSIGDLTLDKNKALFYIVSVLVFALPHMLSTKAEPLDFILMSIPYIYSGLALAFVYERTRNIYTTIAIHMLNNLVAFILIVV